MLTVAEETLIKLATDLGKEVSVHLYGQEVNPETFAISKADLILKGDSLDEELEANDTEVMERADADD